MKFTSDTKKTLDALIPLGAGIGTFYYLYNKKKPWNEVLWISGGVLVLSYFITKSLTKSALTASEAPDHVNVNPDASGTIDANFNPAPFTDRLFNDIQETWGVRDGSIYQDLSNLSNANLLKVYNDWTERYFATDNETMVQAIDNEVFWYRIGVGNIADTIISRLQGMGAY